MTNKNLFLKIGIQLIYLFSLVSISLSLLTADYSILEPWRMLLSGGLGMLVYLLILFGTYVLWFMKDDNVVKHK